MDVQQLRAIADCELRKYGLVDWSFGLNSAKRRLGVCKYRSRRIEISEFYAVHNPAEAVLDTLRHEIAHALAGPGAKHGPRWKAVAKRLGATPHACDRSPETRIEPGQWQARCPACQRVYHRYRRPKTRTGYRCPCPAKSPILFEFQGDPRFQPPVPLTLEESAPWEATCAGCRVVHLRLRRPKAGRWLCKCEHRCELTWRLRAK